MSKYHGEKVSKRKWRASLARDGHVYKGDNDVRNVRVYLLHNIAHNEEGGLENLVNSVTIMDWTPLNDIAQDFPLKINHVMGRFLRIGRKNVEEFNLSSRNASGFFFF